MGSYKYIVVETYNGRYTSDSDGVHARPLEGQGLSTQMNVECSRKMRQNHPVGTRFLIKARVTNREGGPDFLYSHYNSRYQVVTDEELAKYIKNA
jgi:hypothetical protein